MPSLRRLTFVATTAIPVSAEALFDWHEAPGAFEKLTPPSEPVRVLRHEGGIRDGARVSLLVGPWPFSVRWELEHRDYHYGRSFTDVQLSGPFLYWTHVHRMIPDGPHACLLEDAVEYELPFGAIGRLIGRPFVQRKLKRLFTFRHAVTLQDARKRETSAHGTASLRPRFVIGESPTSQHSVVENQ